MVVVREGGEEKFDSGFLVRDVSDSTSCGPDRGLRFPKNEVKRRKEVAEIGATVVQWFLCGSGW